MFLVVTTTSKIVTLLRRNIKISVRMLPLLQRGIAELSRGRRQWYGSCKLAGCKKQCAPFANKSALITGGATGIGFECARSLLSQGCKGITLADVDTAMGEKALKAICEEFGNNKAIFIRCDVTKSEMLDWAFKNTISVYDQVDIVVNNAGVLNDKNWDKEVATNIGGCLVGTLLGLQYMSKTCKGHGGVVVNISSTMALDPYCGCPVYSMTQAGIVGLTRSLGSGCQIERTCVRVMALCVGLTDTCMLKAASKNALNDRFGQEFRDELSDQLMQEPCLVGHALITVLKKGVSGNVWVIDQGGPPYKVRFPEIEEMRVCPGECAEEIECKPKKKKKKRKKSKKSKGKRKMESCGE